MERNFPSLLSDQNWTKFLLFENRTHYTKASAACCFCSVNNSIEELYYDAPTVMRENMFLHRMRNTNKRKLASFLNKLAISFLILVKSLKFLLLRLPSRSHLGRRALFSFWFPWKSYKCLKAKRKHFPSSVGIFFRFLFQIVNFSLSPARNFRCKA